MHEDPSMHNYGELRTLSPHPAGSPEAACGEDLSRFALEAAYVTGSGDGLPGARGPKPSPFGAKNQRGAGKKQRAGPKSRNRPRGGWRRAGLSWMGRN